jgi:hypothetical protein
LRRPISTEAPSPAAARLNVAPSEETA